MSSQSQCSQLSADLVPSLLVRLHSVSFFLVQIPAGGISASSYDGVVCGQPMISLRKTWKARWKTSVGRQWIVFAATKSWGDTILIKQIRSTDTRRNSAAVIYLPLGAFDSQNGVAVQLPRDRETGRTFDSLIRLKRQETWDLRGHISCNKRALNILLRE